MITYGNSSMKKDSPWYDDLTIGTRWYLEGESIMAIFAARAIKLGEPAMVSTSRHGYYAEEVTPSKVKEAVLAVDPTFVLAGRSLYGDEDRPDGNDFWYFHKTGAVHIGLNEKNANVDYVGNDVELAKKLMASIEALLINLPPAGTVYMMTATADGPEFHSVGEGGKDLERGNYAEDILVGYDRIKSELTTSEPRGRLTILNGPAGTGKTFLIRGLLQEVKGAVFVVVQPHFLPSLAEPSALTALTKLRADHEGEPIVLIVEDADECLANRIDGNLSAISAVLNIGDGLMGSVMDVRIVATTNAGTNDFDPAIKRPGRLSTSMTVNKISVAKASEIYERLTGKKALVYPYLDEPLRAEPMILEEMTVAEVYQLAYDAGWKPMVTAKKKSVGFGFASGPR